MADSFLTCIRRRVRRIEWMEVIRDIIVIILITLPYFFM